MKNKEFTAEVARKLTLSNKHKETGRDIKYALHEIKKQALQGKLSCGLATNRFYYPADVIDALKNKGYVVEQDWCMLNISWGEK